MDILEQLVERSRTHEHSLRQQAERLQQPTSSHATVVADLYRKRVIDAATLSRAILKLRLDIHTVAEALDTSPNDLVKELVNVQETPVVRTPVTPAKKHPKWETWDYESAHVALFDPRTPTQLAPELKRSPQSIRAFRYRMRTQGCRVNKAVWELFAEGYKPEEIAKLGYPLWMPKFVELVRKLQKTAVLLGHEPIKVIFT